MGNCGNCQYYGTAPVAGPICTKTGKATSFLAVKDCFEARTTGPEILTKRCNRCHRELPLTEFSRNHTQRDGYQRQCKDCQRELSQALYKKKAEEKAEEPVPPAPPTTKVCTKCKRELPLERFGRNVRATDGLKCYCKDCENENCRKYRAKKYGRKEKPKPKEVAAPVINDLLEEVAVPAEKLTFAEALRQLIAYGSLTIKISISKPESK